MSGSGARPKSIAPPPPAAGELVAGKFRFERVIGEGAMGTVMAAHHELLDMPVAVKLLSSEFARQPNLVERFLREASSAAKLKSEHVVRVMDVGALETGQPFIVMELLEGEDLEARFKRLGRVPVSEAVDWALQALEAIAQAHAIGIVHRDLKPANLFVTQRPDGSEIVKVLDFGVAKLLEARPEGSDGKRVGVLTGEHAALGSPGYMSPEQVRDSRTIDHRADLWAIGTIVYELATGAPAFDGASVADIFSAILYDPPTPLSTHLPEAPEGFEQVVARCLERDVELRWGDAAQLARALAPFGSGSWTDHVERIEKTLARASKASDPDGLRTSRPSVRAGDSFGPIPVSGTRPRPRFSPSPPPMSDLDRVHVVGAETMLGSTRSAPPVRHTSRVGIKTLIAGAGVALATSALVAALHARGQGAGSASASAAPPPPPSLPLPAAEPPAAATTASPVASPTPAASAFSTAPPAPSAHVSPAPRPQSGRPKPPPAQPSAGSTHKPALPSVLDSPD